MSAGDRKLRIALAAFASAGSLGPAVETLVADDVPLTRLGLIVLGSAAIGMLASERAAGREKQPLSQLLANLVPLCDRLEAKIVASPGMTAPWYAGLRAPGLWAGDRTTEAEPRLAPDLERHVLGGAAILTVVSSTTTEHWHCARLLLEQSCAPILALECSLPATM